MTLQDAIEMAVSFGYETAKAIELRSGETVYLLVGGGRIGLPRFIRDVGGLFVLSSDEESMALFDEPSFLVEEEQEGV